MKQSVIPEQHWLHQPTTSDLHRTLQRRELQLVAMILAGCIGWISFLIVVIKFS